MNTDDTAAIIQKHAYQYSQDLWNLYIDNETLISNRDALNSAINKVETAMRDTAGGRGWSSIFLESVAMWWQDFDIETKRRLLRLAIDFYKDDSRPEDERNVVFILANEWRRELD